MNVGFRVCVETSKKLNYHIPIAFSLSLFVTEPTGDKSVSSWITSYLTVIDATIFCNQFENQDSTTLLGNYEKFG